MVNLIKAKGSLLESARALHLGKKRMVHRGHLEAEGEKTSVMLAGEASRIMCVNFMCQGPARGRVRQCFELVGHMDNVAVFSNGNGDYSPMKKA